MRPRPREMAASAGSDALERTMTWAEREQKTARATRRSVAPVSGSGTSMEGRAARSLRMETKTRDSTMASLSWGRTWVLKRWRMRRATSMLGPSPKTFERCLTTAK